MASYKAIYEKARQELQDDKNRDELVAMLRSWRSEAETMLVELEKSKENTMPCSQEFLDNAKIFISGIESNTLLARRFQYKACDALGAL